MASSSPRPIWAEKSRDTAPAAETRHLHALDQAADVEDRLGLK
jgi:hypothetical protein